MASTKPVILITVGTSQNGREAARQLLVANSSFAYTVRLGVHTLSKLDSSLGGEPVLLNDTLESALMAFTGVTAAYIVLLGMAGGVERTLFLNFLQAAKESPTLKHIVLLTGISASLADPPSGNIEEVQQNGERTSCNGRPTTREAKIYNGRSNGICGLKICSNGRSSQNSQWTSERFVDQLKSHGEHEELLRESEICYTILRPAWFHENTTTWLAMSITTTGQFKSSAGDGVWTSIAVANIAAVAVDALMNPGSHANQVYELQEEAITDGELAQKISKTIGKKVTHVNLTPGEHKAMIMNFYPPQSATEAAELLVILDALRCNGTFSHVGPDLEHMLGCKGITLDAFLAQYKQVFL